MLRLLRGVSYGCTFLLILLSTPLASQTTSVQLVGNFNGISCEPDDPANDMLSVGEHQWRKLKFIDEQSDPDTVFFKFTREYSYLPEHWGWDNVLGWGIAKLDFNPPSIGAILPDSGYHFFNFNDTTYAYWIDRPNGNITAFVSAESDGSVPDGAYVSLLDSLYHVIGSHLDMTDSTALFEHLPPAPYHLVAGATGYRDTTISNIVLDEDGSIQFSIHLKSSVSTAITSSFYEHVQGGIILRWSTACCDDPVSFDVYRGTDPTLELMEKRTAVPISGTNDFEFFDPVEDPRIDLYYYLVEKDSDDPTIYGPIFAPGIEIVFDTHLGQNYPNPFNPATTIPYRIGTAEAGKPIHISFFDVAGRRIESYDLGAKPIGDYTFRWNPSTSAGRSIPSGVYYCRLQIGKASFTGKLILLR